MKVRRYSRQREMIYQKLSKTRLHPTAEMLYLELKEEHPELSLATVYRNLNLLAEDGKILRLNFPVERFDADITQHDHFQCGCCGTVLDIPTVYDQNMDAHAAAVSGHSIEKHSTIFQGTCKNCTQQNNI